MPAVSVVIPCFNSAAFLAETVASVLAQTRSDWEIVFVDDGSTDATPELMGRLIAAQAQRPMRVVRQANAGVAAARNAGIAAARGRYILPLDADDRIAPTMLAECAAVLDAEPQTSLVYCDRRDFGDVDRVWPAGRYELGRLKYFNQIAYCTLFRRTMWEDLGGFCVDVSGFDDWDFWLGAAARGHRGRHVAQPLLLHRRHRGSQLWRLLDRYEALNAHIVLNHRDVYTPAEVAMAERYLATGESEPLLAAARAVFVGRHCADCRATGTDGNPGPCAS